MINDFFQWVAIGVLFAIVFTHNENISKLGFNVLDVDDKVNRLRKNLKKLGD